MGPEETTVWMSTFLGRCTSTRSRWMQIRLRDAASPSIDLVSQFAGGKPFGVRIASGVPATDVLAREVNWRWMLLSPAAASGSAAVSGAVASGPGAVPGPAAVSGPAALSGSDAIKAFYADPHVVAGPQK